MGGTLDNKPLRPFNISDKETRMGEKLNEFKLAFQTNFPNGAVNKTLFHERILGDTVPFLVGSAMYDAFLGRERGMNFNVPAIMDQEDFTNFMVILLAGTDKEKACLLFDTFRRGSEFVMLNDIKYFSNLLAYPDGFGERVWEACRLHPTEYITKIQFIKIYNSYKKNPLFSLLEGISGPMEEIEQAGKEDVTFMRTMTGIALSEEMKLIKSDMNISDYYLEEIDRAFRRCRMRAKGSITQEFLISLFEKYSIGDQLKKYIASAFLANDKDVTFRSFVKVLYALCIQNNLQDKLGFMYDIVVKDLPKHLLKIKDFNMLIAALQLTPKELREINTRVKEKKLNSINKQQFKDILSFKDINLRKIEELKYLLNLELEVYPETRKREKEAILYTFNYFKNPHDYVIRNLTENEKYFLVDKKFWIKWCKGVDWQDVYPSKPSEMPERLDNISLLTDGFSFKLKQLVYNRDFILLNSRAWSAFQVWYKARPEICRTVRKFKKDKYEEFKVLPSAMRINTGEGKGTRDWHAFKNEERDPGYVMELELDEIFFYFYKIPESGKRPVYTKPASGVRTLFGKSKDINTFYEMYISRLKTLREVFDQCCTFFRTKANRGRMWIGDNIILESMLEQTFETYIKKNGITVNEVIYFESQFEDETWPSSQVEEARKRKFEEVTTPLNNLGNTCYINAALQCFANTPFLYEYLQNYNENVNYRNGLAHRGKLVNAFATLICDMKESKQCSLKPLAFKKIIGQLNDQFQGFEQQDSQEFLNFLMDGLHEEVNQRIKKPYIQNPESESRNLYDLSIEYWANSLERNWSFFNFMFYGQLGSTLTCTSCGKTSTTFDAFTNISLPIPERGVNVINVILAPISSYLRGMITRMDCKEIKVPEGEIESPDILESLDIIESTEIIESRKILESTESPESLESPDPSYIQLLVPINRQELIQDLINKILEIPDLSLNPLSSKGHTEVILCYVWNKSISITYDPKKKVGDYRLENQTWIHAFEMVTKKGYDTINGKEEEIEEVEEEMEDMEEDSDGLPSAYLEDKDNSEHVETEEADMKMGLSYASPKKGFGGESTDLDDREAGEGIQEVMGFTMIPGLSQGPNPQGQGLNPQGLNPLNPHSNTNPNPKSTKSNISPIVKTKLDKYSAFNYHGNYGSMTLMHTDINVTLTERIISCYHRRIIEKSSPIFHKYEGNTFGQGFVINVAPTSTELEIYESVWYRARDSLKSTSIYIQNADNLWWSRQNEERTSPHLPFVIRRIKYNSSKCSQCPWNKKCLGCALPADPEKLVDIQNNESLAIDWDSEIIKSEYQSMRTSMHPSIKQLRDKEAQPVQIDTCLKSFTEEEKLSTHCGRCKEDTQFTKKLDFYKLPKVLIVHLKRYKENWNQKNMVMVKFPEHDLDMSTYMPIEARNQQLDTKYELYAIINHYGFMLAGHYTAFVKSGEASPKWFYFDDSRCSMVSDDEIHLPNAYILFYKLRTIDEMKMSEILPDFQFPFVGKPVNTSFGRGYIQQIRKGTDCPFVVKMRDSTLTARLKADSVWFEDSESIRNEFKMMANEHNQGSERPCNIFQLFCYIHILYIIFTLFRLLWNIHSNIHKQVNK